MKSDKNHYDLSITSRNQRSISIFNVIEPDTMINHGNNEGTVGIMDPKFDDRL